MNIIKFIRDLFLKETPGFKKDPIVIGGEYYIILPEMVIKTLNNPKDHKGFYSTPRLRYYCVSSQIGKLIKEKSNKNKHVPEGYGFEMLPDSYEITNSTEEEEIFFPILLRHYKDDLYEAIGLSTTKTRRLRDWWDIRNACPEKGYYILKVSKS